ncbi:AraC family transcriptional regulator [Paenibacillus sp. FSL H8-0034]|uniref:AraC family transcriptional regulator n=1 Tax=Paenibacillus sp. FSL H8-0034 TaxID=2954671 RepID=UPI0030FCEE1A
MSLLFKLKSFNNKQFWKFFAKYFMLILIPAIVASTFMNLFVVSLIQNEAEQSSHIVMKNNAHQADEKFHSLQADMINLLSSSNLKSILKNAGKTPVSMEQTDMIYAMMAQLNSIISEPLVSGTFLYFVNSDLVIDNNIYTNKSFYFKNYYSLDESESSKLITQFKGKQMMHFTEPYPANLRSNMSSNNETSGSNVSVIMSYPFNSVKPEVYLEVHFQKDKLERLIQTQESWIFRTAIINADGTVISQSDTAELNKNSLNEAILTKSEGAFSPYNDKQAVSFVRSEYDSSWYYISWIDINTLMKPAETLRFLSIGFLLFFLLVGAFVSYYLSRRLYTPILEIRNRLQAHQSLSPPDAADDSPDGNDFDIIKRFSKLLITEHKEMSQWVKGALPIVQEDFITQILLGEYRDNLSIEYYSKEIAFPVVINATRTVLIIEYHYYDNVLEQLSETSKSFLLVELREKIWKQVSDKMWLSQTRSDLLACVVHHDLENALDLLEISNQLKLVLEPYMSYFKSTIGIGKTVHEIGNLHDSYQYGFAMLKQKSLNAEVEICCEDDTWENRAQFDSFLSSEEVNRIVNLHKTQEYDRMLQSVLQMLELGERKQAGAMHMKSLCSDVLNTWIRAVETERNDFNISLYSGLFELLNRCQTWDELKRHFEHIHSLLFLSPSTVNRNDQFMEVVEYIKEHYQEELSIEWFAGKMNMSVSHFSRSFKEAVGEKYMEYITKYRLSMAKKLLNETDMKIEEIAESVGYLGSNAFIRMFRKYEGITPGKYRSVK